MLFIYIARSCVRNVASPLDFASLKKIGKKKIRGEEEGHKKVLYLFNQNDFGSP